MNLQKECLIKFLEPDFEFADDRGKLTQLFREGWSQVNVITSKAGSVRGHHYHKNNHEFFYVISGQFTLSVSRLQDGATEQFALKPEMMFVILQKFYIHLLLRVTCCCFRHTTGESKREVKWIFTWREIEYEICCSF